MSDPTPLCSQLDEALRVVRKAFKQTYSLCEISRRIDKPLDPNLAERIASRTNAVLQLRNDAWRSYQPVRASIQGLSGRKAAFELVWDFLSNKYVAIITGCGAVRFGEPPLLLIPTDVVASHWPMLRGWLLLPFPDIERARYLKLCRRMDSEHNEAKIRIEMNPNI
jgi:hypothetical protein